MSVIPVKLDSTSLVLSRMIVAWYGSHLLEEFLTVAFALVGKSLYLRSVLKEHTRVSGEDLAAANRILVSLAGRFIQNGSTLLAESVKNAVIAVFGKVSLQEPTSKTLLCSLISQVRHEIESSCGKSILDDCIYAKLDEMVSADLSPIKRRLLIGLVTEARCRMRQDELRNALFAQIATDLDSVVTGLFDKEPSRASDVLLPFLAYLPKINKCYHTFMTKPPSIDGLCRHAAVIFVDLDTHVLPCFLQLQ